MNVILWIMLVFMVIIFVQLVIRGPSIWDRLLGVSVTSVKVILFIIFFASINDRAYLLDFAIICAMFGFIGTIFIALFLSNRGKGRDKKGKEGNTI